MPDEVKVLFRFEGIDGLFASALDAMLAESGFRKVDDLAEKLVEEEASEVVNNGGIETCYGDDSELVEEYRDYIREILRGRGVSTRDPDGDFDSEYEETIQDGDQQFEFLREKLLEDGPYAIVEGHLESWLESNPVTGVFSRGLNCLVPIEGIAGFCPRCRDTVSTFDVGRKDGDVEPTITCRNCGLSGLASRVQIEHGHAFDEVPGFKDLSLRELRGEYVPVPDGPEDEDDRISMPGS